jgi:pimeloyl-ACP methyl ester carboxylesterase
MNKPTLVLVHGYPFDHSMWDLVISMLGDKVHVIAPDLRGFGGPQAGDAEPSIDLLADDIARALDDENIPRAVVAGMSMGGYVALSFAEHCKARLSGLGLINTQVLADTEEARTARRAMIQTVQEEGPEVAAKSAIQKLFAPANSQQPELLRFPLEAAKKAGVEGISWALEAMARRPDRSDLLRSLQVPVLVVHGEEDRFIPSERARSMAALNPQASYLEIPNAGHCTPLEAPQPVATALLELVERSTAPSRAREASGS